ncbi:MAG: ISKra4 family transposase [Candidatus Brocadiae bacterium]|nr:ISKra4 family transposase [Candidatus Brocadiia bacterium]
MLTVETPYKKVSEELEKIFSLKIPVGSLEKINRDMSDSAAPYRQEKPIPPKEEEGKFLVRGGDGKGVPVRHSQDQARIYEHQHKTGPKPDRKRMSIVGATYSVDEYIRTPEQIVDSLFREPGVQRESDHDRPHPQHKQVFAQLTQQHGEIEVKATGVVFEWMNSQIAQRDPDNSKKHIVLMDGQPSLWEAAKKYFSDDYIEILDLLHATPRLWEVANMMYHNDNEKLEFIRQRVLRILRGQVNIVIREFRNIATWEQFSAAKRKDLTTICGYLEKNKHRMQYDQYLAAGYPIASGVIEGDCRHFVKDRMERAGMRWTIDGAQSMLNLRSTYLNGDWENFLQYRIHREESRLYPYAQIVEHVVCPISA